VLRRKDEVNLLYSERSDRIHTVSQLLRAYSLYSKDDEYVVTDDGKVQIVDEFTGGSSPAGGIPTACIRQSRRKKA